jgi:hypothetical protein
VNVVPRKRTQEKWHLSYEVNQICVKPSFPKRSKSVKEKNGLSIWEDLILINARSPDGAYRKAILRGRAGEQTIRIGNTITEIKFLGLRDLVAVSSQLKDGAELDRREMKIRRQELDEKILRKRRLRAFNINSKWIKATKSGWYISREIHCLESMSGRRADRSKECVAWERLILIEARNPDDAYRKAVTNARLSEREVDISGRKGFVKFRGFLDLVYVYVELRDGAELMWQEYQIKKSELSDIVALKRQLRIFRKRERPRTSIRKYGQG